ncbi:MAG: hypothetical protein IPG59_08755 [Candidatus Melainabacteria bacterium]|nr:MAG: hypothetical protein IPG59_08755 [Candidatus Melainabacteria bacterium]
MKLKIALLLATTFGLSISFAFAEASNKDKLKLPEEIGRKENSGDMNLLQLQPTVMNERHYTSGKSERHQRMSPTLPEGAPIPDRDPTPAEKIDQAVKDKIKSMQDQEQEIKLNVSCTTCSSSFIELLKQIKGLDIIKVDSESKTIALKLPANLVQKLAQYTGVFKIRLYGIPQAS